jgi:hypothetical protein
MGGISSVPTADAEAAGAGRDVNEGDGGAREGTHAEATRKKPTRPTVVCVVTGGGFTSEEYTLSISPLRAEQGLGRELPEARVC